MLRRNQCEELDAPGVSAAAVADHFGEVAGVVSGDVVAAERDGDKEKYGR